MSSNFLDLANPGVKGLHPYVPGKPVEELERELGITNIVKLASNENPLGPSESVLQAIQKALPELSRYPDGNGFTLKAALAEHLSVDADQITLGNGSNDVLELLARTFLSVGDEVIFSEHAFAVYPIVTQAVGATAVVTPARNWAHDLDAMADAITDKTKLIFIANPNNPTGTWLSKGELKAFLKIVPEHVVVVLDEAYFEYVDQENYPDGIKLLKHYPNLVVTRTFSKIYGLASLRVGYGISNPDIADLLNRVRQPFNVNALAQAAAVAALADSEYLLRSREVNARGLEQLIQGFETLDLDYISSVGNFICVHIGEKAAQANDELLREGVIVRPVANYRMPEYLRVTVGTEQENETFLHALKRVLDRI